MERLDSDFEKLMLEAGDDKTRSKRLGELAKASSTLGRLVAGNPNADPQLLAELASGEDEEIRREWREIRMRRRRYCGSWRSRFSGSRWREVFPKNCSRKRKDELRNRVF